MRSLICLYFALIASSILYAGDTPCTATLLNTDNPDFVLFDNTSNSNSGIDAPPYGGYVGPDTWISFIMPNGGFYLILHGTTMIDPAIAVYSGDCIEPKLLYNILDDNCDGSPNPVLFIDKLTPGQQYYIRVWAQDGSPNGAFEIKLVQTISTIPDFIAFADATIVGNCIELTQNTGNQQGCAWYQNAIDFTMPFSHEMTANFGTTDAGGADGICLVYQSNGQDFCGGTGEGIGASGMPNSAIFEFDTWQNGNLNDPAQDHCAFNINGNMNHNSSIEGPVTLGNIEDGLDHTILFEWNPVGNLYSVYFDGALVLNGSFDIVNNCFGGSTTAFWGYTSATGGSSNLQVICPIVETVIPSYTEYNEVDICEGESFMGHFESGFYVDFIPGPDGCDYQLNTLVTVHELSEPEYLYEVVCEGEYILVADEVFTLPDLYEINTTTEFGCDSTIYLQLDNIVPTVEVETPPAISCLDTAIQLVPIPGANFPIDMITYTWSSGSSSTNQEILVVDDAGTYYLTAVITTNGEQCIATTNVTIEVDTMVPMFENLPDVFLDCTNIDTDTLLLAPELGNDVVPIWLFEDSIVGNEDILNVMGEGVYTLIAMDTLNGCTHSDSFSLNLSNDIPNIQLNAGHLNCEITNLSPSFSSTGDIDSIIWNYNNTFFSLDSLPSISEAGIYDVQVITTDGCKSSASVTVEIDTILPKVILNDSLIQCDINSMKLDPITDPDLLLEWSSSQNYQLAGQSIVIDNEGWYHLMVTDPINQCTNSDSAYIQFKGNSPTLQTSNDTINCYTPSVILETQSDQMNLSYTWTNTYGFTSEEETIQVDEEGWYFIEAMNTNGCKTLDSIQVLSNFSTPGTEITFDTINCINMVATVETQIENGVFDSWQGPSSMQEEENFTTNTEGLYVLTAINLASGCKTLDTITIVNTSIIPVFSLQAGELNCNSLEIQLPFSLATPYVSLEWSGPDGFTSNLIDPIIDQSGEYTVHVEFDGNCTLDTFLIVDADFSVPEYLIDFDSLTCFAPETTISTTLMDVNDQLTIHTPGGNTETTTLFTTQDSGFYYLAIEGNNGCVSLDTFYIPAYLDLPQVTLSNFEAITCDKPIIEIYISSLEEHLVHVWSGPNNFNSTNDTINVEEQGTYSIQTQNEYGCAVESEIEVEAFIEIPEISLEGFPIFCDKPESTLYCNTADQMAFIQWDSPNTFIDFHDSIIVNQEGWYVVHIENEYGCRNSDSLFIESLTDAPILNLLTPDTLNVDVDFPEGQIFLEVSTTFDFNIEWFPSEGLSCSDCLDPQIIGVGSPVYEVVITDENGCQSSEKIIIRYQRELNVDIPNVFSPSNQDGQNDFFTLYGNENVASINSMVIFDRWGNRVAEAYHFLPNTPSLGWDGHISGKLGQSGVYVYIFEIITTEGKILLYQGTITLL